MVEQYTKLKKIIFYNYPNKLYAFGHYGAGENSLYSDVQYKFSIGYAYRGWLIIPRQIRYFNALMLQPKWYEISKSIRVSSNNIIFNSIVFYFKTENVRHEILNISGYKTKREAT